MIGPVALTLVFDIVMLALVLVVGGVVLWLHVRLDGLRTAGHKLPVLADQFMQQLAVIQKEMQQLKTDLAAAAPQLDALLKDSTTVRQDLDFMTKRAVKVADKLEALTADMKDLEQAQTVAPATPHIPADVSAKVVEDVLEPQLPLTPLVKPDVTRQAPQQEVPVSSRREQALRSALGVGGER